MDEYFEVEGISISINDIKPRYPYKAHHGIPNIAKFMGCLAVVLLSVDVIIFLIMTAINSEIFITPDEWPIIFLWLFDATIKFVIVTIILCLISVVISKYLESKHTKIKANGTKYRGEIYSIFFSYTSRFKTHSIGVHANANFYKTSDVIIDKHFKNLVKYWKDIPLELDVYIWENKVFIDFESMRLKNWRIDNRYAY